MLLLTKDVEGVVKLRSIVVHIKYSYKQVCVGGFWKRNRIMIIILTNALGTSHSHCDRAHNSVALVSVCKQLTDVLGSSTVHEDTGRREGNTEGLVAIREAGSSN